LSFYKQGNREHRSFDFFPEGAIIEFIPNKRISYTWQEPNTVDFPRTVVTWELEELENNKTRVELLHKGFQAGKLFEHDEGWSYFLNQLQKYCGNRGLNQSNVIKTIKRLFNENLIYNGHSRFSFSKQNHQANVWKVLKRDRKSSMTTKTADTEEMIKQTIK
jgi:Activator of Hsp90 ATPase homolog 1-like protein